MGKKYLDNIDAVFDLNRMTRIPLARNLLYYKNISVGRAVFSHDSLTSRFKTDETAPLTMSAH